MDWAARQGSNEQGSGTKRAAAASHSGAGRLRLHQHDPAHGFQVHGLRHKAVRLVQANVCVERTAERRLHMKQVPSRVKRRDGTRGVAAQRSSERAVHVDFCALGPSSDVQTHRHRLRPRQRRHDASQQCAFPQHSFHRSTTFHRFAFIRASTSRSLRDASLLRSSFGSLTNSSRT